MIGSKSGAPSVRKIIRTYREINDFLEGFLEKGGLLLADKCDPLDGFKSCIGGAIGSRRLTTRVPDEMNQIFDFEDTSRQPTFPSHLLEKERELETDCKTDAFVLPTCAGTCTGCKTLEKAKCLQRYLACKGKSVNGLTFPFMSDLASVAGLLSGGDIVSNFRVGTALRS
jgi:hypothetical protein